MAQLTTPDLREGPASYDSPRDLYDVLIGEDTARPLIEASSSGNNATVQSLLSQPRWINIMLESPHCIYQESRPSQGPTDMREVTAMPMSNLQRALTIAAENGQAAVVSTLLAFAKQQNLDVSEILSKPIMYKIIQSGQVDLVKALASGDPSFINTPVAHGTLPLYEAVRFRRTDVVDVLLKLGADPLHPVVEGKTIGSYNSSLMSFAAMAEGPRMIEMLLECGTPLAQTGALHTASRQGKLDTIRFLVQHGAEVDEGLSNWRNWTPMHFAASKGQVDAFKLLEQCGARSDLKDEDGKTPAQLLEEYNAA